MDRMTRLLETPAGLRARAAVRVEEAHRSPRDSDERRRNLMIAAEYERKADNLEAVR